jgi:hypothetical protein
MAAIPSAPGPSTPLTSSYTYHSPTPSASGPYILGVDEAGRGPVLGPLAYGVAYCPEAFKDEMEGLGFNGAINIKLMLETRNDASFRRLQGVNGRDTHQSAGHAQLSP